MPEAIEAARDAFLALASGNAVVPLRAHVATANGFSLFMPAYAPALGSVGLKIATVTPENPSRNLPTVQAIVILVDESTGSPVAVLDGTYLTQVRTGAAIGLAAEQFARPDAMTVALFGAGATARTSLSAVCAVRPIRDVRVIHPHAERFAAFEADMRSMLGSACPSLRRVESPIEALTGAAIAITATTATTPLFPGGALEPGAFVGALGAYTPRMRELDTATIRRSRLVVDTRSGALNEAGDVVIPIQEGAITAEHIHAELGEVLRGDRPGRSSPDEIVVFKSVGNAMQDLALAARVYQRARELGLGTEVTL
jgi:ornithine cyclodeaminase/alanine dehydrogenase-like protein (mu-crystallin family)